MSDYNMLKQTIEHGDCKRVLAYLTKTRGLDYNMVVDLVKQGRIAQEERTGNVLFKYFDDSGNLAGVEKVGTLSDKKFKGIAAGSASDRGFEIVRGNGEKAYFFESSIDMLSYLQMNKDLDNCRLVSIMGLKPDIVIGTVERNNIRPDNVFICTDNDEAGNRFYEDIAEENTPMESFHRIRTPDNFKDWNDMLRGIEKEVEKMQDKPTRSDMIWFSMTNRRDMLKVTVSQEQLEQLADEFNKYQLPFAAVSKGENAVFYIDKKSENSVKLVEYITNGAELSAAGKGKDPVKTFKNEYVENSESASVSLRSDLAFRVAKNAKDNGIKFTLAPDRDKGKLKMTFDESELNTIAQFAGEVKQARMKLPERIEELERAAEQAQQAELERITAEISSRKKAFAENIGDYSSGEIMTFAAELRELEERQTALKEKVQSKSIEQSDIDKLRAIEPKRKSVQNLLDTEVAQVPKFEAQQAEKMGEKSAFELRSGILEEYENSRVPIISVSSRNSDFKTVKDSIKSQEITRNNVLNVTANIDIQISRRGLEDTLNYASRHNDSATMDMLYHLNDIIKNSAYLDTKISEENNKNKAHNSVFMHNLYSIVKRDEKYYLAKIAVEEFIAEKDKTGLRFYNLQSIKIEPSRHLTFGEINQNRLALSVLNGSDISISQLRELVKIYDKNFYENEQAVGRPERLDEIAVDTAVSKAINEAQQAAEEKEMTGLFSIEQNGELRYYKTNNRANDLLNIARNSEQAFIDLAKMGTHISEAEYAEIEQSDRVKYFADFDLDRQTADITAINGGRGGIAENDRKDSDIVVYNQRLKPTEKSASYEEEQLSAEEMTAKTVISAPITKEMYHTDTAEIHESHDKSAEYILARIEIDTSDELYARLAEHGVKPTEHSLDKVILETDNENWFSLAIPDSFGNIYNNIPAAEVFTPEEISAAREVAEEVIGGHLERTQVRQLSFDTQDKNIDELPKDILSEVYAVYNEDKEIVSPLFNSLSETNDFIYQNHIVGEHGEYIVMGDFDQTDRNFIGEIDEIFFKDIDDNTYNEIAALKEENTVIDVSDLSELIDIEKLTVNGDTVYWEYFNEDGNDGKGQLVELTFTADDISEAFIAMETAGEVSEGYRAYLFVNHLQEHSSQTMTDYGSEDFEAAKEHFINGEHDFTVSGADSSRKIVEFLTNAFPENEISRAEEQAITAVPDLSDLIGIEKLTVNGDTVYWEYFNEDGNDGKGQLVELTFTADDISEASKVMETAGGLTAEGCRAFTDYITENGAADITDFGSADFEAAKEHFINGEHDFTVSGADSSREITEFLTNAFPQRVEEREESPVIEDFRAKTDEYFHDIDGHSAEEIEALVREHAEAVFADSGIEATIKGVVLDGSRSRGIEHDGSDIDVVMEIESELREDALFNILHENELTIGGIVVDVNPIRADQSGTLEEYLPRAEEYLKNKAHDMVNTAENEVSVSNGLTSVTDKEFAVLLWENAFDVFVDGGKLPEYVVGGENWEYVERINNSDSIQAYPADIEKEQMIDGISGRVYDICLKYDNDESLISSYADEAEPPFEWENGQNVYENVERALVEGNTQFIEDFLNAEIPISDELDALLDEIEAYNSKYDVESADITSELTDNEKLFLECDIVPILAKGSLAWDEIESLGYRFFDKTYIEKRPASDRSIFGEGLHEPDLYALIRRQRSGEDITKELVTGLLGSGTFHGRMTDSSERYTVEYSISQHDEGYTLSYGTVSREVTFKELESAYYDLFYGEWDKNTRFAVYEFLKDDIPDISEKTVDRLIDAFDGAAMHGWEIGDDQAKINHIKKALDEVLGDEEQTEKAFECIAKHKYGVELAVNEPVKEEPSLHFGSFGNGITAYDTARIDPETDDYLELAHISVEGNLRLFTDDISPEDMDRIQAQAQSVREKFMAEWDKLSVDEKYNKVLDSSDIITAMNITGDREKLTKEQAVEKYTPFVIFHEGERPEEEPDEPEQAEELSPFYVDKETEQELENAFEEVDGKTQAAQQERVEKLKPSVVADIIERAANTEEMQNSVRNSDIENQKTEAVKQFDKALTEIITENIANDDDDLTVEINKLETLRTANSIIGHGEEYAEDIISKAGKIAAQKEDITAENKPLIAHKVGSFYEFYDKDSEIISKTLNINSMPKQGHMMSGFPDYMKQSYTDKLAAAGYSVIFEEPMDRAMRLINEFCEKEFDSPANFSNLDHVDIAYTTDEDTDIEIQVYADLEAYRLVTEYGGKEVKEELFDSVEDMCGALESLDFSELTALSDEEKGLTETELTIEKPFWEEQDENGEQLSMFGEPEPIKNTSPAPKKKDHSEGIFVGGVNRFTALHDEITRGTGYVNGKFRVQDFYKKNNPTNREFADFLKKEYGIGGHSGSGDIWFVNYDSKGIEFILNNEEKFRFTWVDAAKMTAEIIDKGEYITQTEFDKRVEREESAEENDESELETMSQIDTELDQERNFEEHTAEKVDNDKSDVSENFTIADEKLGAGGAKAKYRANIEAIKTLKTIESENRPATAEEKEILSKYVGWGGVQEAFDTDKPTWASEYAELKGLLTDEEYRAARATVNDAFYTSPTVIDGIYHALEQFDFDGGRVLEPSMGVGNFFGRMPEEMRANSELYGVEIDSISGRIAQTIYPEADIAVQGFEKNSFQNGCFDVAVGNVPFGDLSFTDKQHGTHQLHDYFFAEALDKIKEGGVIAFITSSGTLDKRDEGVRQMLADKADIIGAVRLPGGKDGAFKENAGTEVTSDIIFLQKHENKSAAEMSDVPDWVHIGETADGLPINKYYEQHPDMVLGEVVKDSNPFSSGIQVLAKAGASLKEQLLEAVGKLKAVISREPARDVYPEKSAKREGVTVPDDLPDQSFFENKGRLYITKNSLSGEVYFDEANIPKNAEEKVKAYIELRDTMRGLINAMTNDYSDETIKNLQAQLTQKYDDFTVKHGILHDKNNTKILKQDGSFNLVAQLEASVDKNKVTERSAMFTERTIKPPKPIDHVDTPVEALALSIAQKGKVDFEYMAKLTDRAEDSVKQELLLQGEIFRVPHTEDYQTADEYLSGDLSAKLKAAEAAAAEDTSYNSNVKAIQSAMPEPLKAGDIDVRIGAAWVKPEIYEQFIYETLQTPRDKRSDYGVKFPWIKPIKVEYEPITDKWYITNKSSDRSTIATKTYGTDKMNAYNVFEHLLNLQDPKVYKTIEVSDGNGDTVEKRVIDTEATKVLQSKAEKLTQAFEKWIFADPKRREELVSTYNEIFNSVKPREYDGSRLSFPMMNTAIKLHAHQKNAIAHAMFGGNTLFAHAVGAGKTFEMIATAMESKRLGLCTKSLFAVPNHLTEQIGADFMKLYPSANILVATKNDFKKENRQQLFAKIATGNYDAVIIGHSQLGMIKLSPEREKTEIQRQIDEITEAIKAMKSSEGSKTSVKKLENTKKGLIKRMNELKETKHDDMLTFEQLGIDRLFVDEAHEFKNLYTFSKLENIAGIGNTPSKKANDLYLKCRYLDEKTGGKGVILATGTPLTNSLTELHVMMRYLEHDLLKAKGLEHFDNFIGAFGVKKTDWELAPAGKGFKQRTRIPKFTGVPEIQALFKQIADVRTADTLKLDVPECEIKVVESEPTELQQELVDELADRAESVQSGGVDPKLDNLLKITSDGRKVGLDPRLVDPTLPDDEGIKLNKCVENVARIHAETAEQKSTQIIFCDLGVPSRSSQDVQSTQDGDEVSAAERDSLEEVCDFCVYDDLRDKLIAKGIPKEEIAYIHDAKTEKAKDELFAKVRSGEVRVLIGSTAKMGTGTNVQKKLIAVHDLDIPWRPADLEQRAGRIIRQGNENKSVNIFRYVTKGTFDAYSYQILEKKQQFISQIMTSKSPARRIDDVDQQALTFAEIKTLCTQDDRIKEKLSLENEVQTLQTLVADHTNTVYEMEDKIKAFPDRERCIQAEISELTADLDYVKQLPRNEAGTKPELNITIGGKRLDSRADIAEAVNKAFLSITTADTPIKIGKYHDLDMYLTANSQSNFVTISRATITIKGHAEYRIDIDDPSSIGTPQRLENALSEAALESRIEMRESNLTRLRSDLAEAKKIVSQPFPQEDELAQKQSRLKTLTEELTKEAIEAKKNAPAKQKTCYFSRAEHRKNLKKNIANVAPQKQKTNESGKDKQAI